MRPFWYCILSLSQYCRCYIPDTADFVLTQYTLFPYCRCSPSDSATLLVLHTFSPRTASVTFLIMRTFSSDHTSCPSTADEALLILYTLSSHCTTFSSYCKYDPPGTAHFLYSHRTLSSYWKAILKNIKWGFWDKLPLFITFVVRQHHQCKLVISLFTLSTLVYTIWSL